MFSLRYARALVEAKSKQLGSYSAVARQTGLTYRRFWKILKGEESMYRLGERIERWLGVKPITIYVPAHMSDEEIDRRLAIARRGGSK